jgi:hypothetical protein
MAWHFSDDLTLLSRKIQYRIEGVDSSRPAPNSDAERLLRLDPRTMPYEWLFRRISLPAPFQKEALAARSDESALESVLGKFFSQSPNIENFPSLIRNANTIENYRLGVLKTGRNESVPFSLPLDWGRTDLGINHQAELHSLRLLTSFMDEHQTTGEPSYLRVLEDILLDWIEKNPYLDPVHPRAWHEGTVVKRLLVLTYLTERYKTVVIPHRISWKLLVTAIYQHAEFLMAPESYIPNGNHGMRQDLALITASLVLPVLDRSETWRRTGLDRLKTKQMDSGFSQEGIWKEHSPGYHCYVMKILNEISELLETNAQQSSSDGLRELNARSRRYLAHVITPGGSLPPVGDTFESDIPKELIDSDQILYSHSGGSQGAAPQELDGFFPDGGEAVFRDSWHEADRSYGANATYIHMHAAYHPEFGHRHADELSFILYSQGRWWITEAGKYGYDEGEHGTFIQSAQAHNGYILNGDPMTSLEKSAVNFVKFEDSHVSTQEIAAVRATSNRFHEDAEAIRTYVFLRNRRTLVLLDQLNAKAAGEWQGFINLASDLSWVKTGSTIEAVPSAKFPLRLSVAIEHSNLEGIQVVKGQQDPLLGWSASDFRKLEPSPVIIVSRRGSDIVAATVIRIGNETAPMIEDLSSKHIGNAIEVAFAEGDEMVRIQILNSKPLKVDCLIGSR